MSEPAVSEFVGFSRREREKTVLLEELVTLRSDDISKLDVDETLLIDLHGRQHSLTKSDTRFRYHAWGEADDDGSCHQALRQLYGASHRGPRLRSSLIGPQQSRQPPAAELLEAGHSQHRKPHRPSAGRIRRVLRPPTPPQPPQPMSPADGADSLADELVTGSLTSAVHVNQLSREAACFVRQAMANAEARLASLAGAAAAAESDGRSLPSVVNT